MIAHPGVAHSPPFSEASKSQTFHGMNLMRGIAAIAVVVFHSDSLFGIQIMRSGYLAVDFFFLLSGFVIAHAYDPRLSRGMSFREFAVARMARFMPLYLVGALLGLLLEIVLLVTGSNHAQGVGQLVLFATLGLLFVPLLKSGAELFPLNLPSWSLHHELVVNLLFAVFHRRLTMAVLLVVASVSCIGVISGVSFWGSSAFGPMSDHYAVALARAAFSFSVGVMIYRTQPWRSVLPPKAAMFLIGALFLVPAPPWLRPWFDLTTILVVFPLLLPSLAAYEPRTSFMTRASTFLGDMSYGLYALHYPLIWLVRGACDRVGLSSVLCGFLLVIFLPLACAVIERRFDFPIRRWIGRSILTRVNRC